MSAATGPLQYALTPNPTEAAQQKMAASSSATSSPSHAPSPAPHHHHPHLSSSSAFNPVLHPVVASAHPHPHPHQHSQTPTSSSPSSGSSSSSAVHVHHSHPQSSGVTSHSPASSSASPASHSSHSSYGSEPRQSPASSSSLAAPVNPAHLRPASPGALSRGIQFTPFPFPVSTPLPARSAFPTTRYTKVRTIRKTLFGKVVLYQDTLTHRLVAIKLSDRMLLERGTTTSGNKVAEDPQEEIRTMNILSGNLRNTQGVSRESLPDHVRRGERYVLTSLGEYEDASYLYTVMPFCSKGEFFDLVCHETKFAEEKARTYFEQMVLGVRYMHALGMVHLDLSLENLLMTEDDDLKICDYGVTRHLAYSNSVPPHPLPFAPSSTNKPGKMGYMAPEIFSSRAFSGPLADVWSMGIVLFISLFGVPPYQIPAASDQRFALIFQGQIQRLLQAWRMTEVASKDAVDLISRMLSEESKRITVDEIMQHPWLKNAKQRSQPPHDLHAEATLKTAEEKAHDAASQGRMETQ